MNTRLRVNCTCHDEELVVYQLNIEDATTKNTTEISSTSCNTPENQRSNKTGTARYCRLGYAALATASTDFRFLVDWHLENCRESPHGPGPASCSGQCDTFQPEKAPETPATQHFKPSQDMRNSVHPKEPRRPTPWAWPVWLGPWKARRSIVGRMRAPRRREK